MPPERAHREAGTQARQEAHALIKNPYRAPREALVQLRKTHRLNCRSLEQIPSSEALRLRDCRSGFEDQRCDGMETPASLSQTTRHSRF